MRSNLFKETVAASGSAAYSTAVEVKDYSRFAYMVNVDAGTTGFTQVVCTPQWSLDGNHWEDIGASALTVAASGSDAADIGESSARWIKVKLVVNAATANVVVTVTAKG